MTDPLSDQELDACLSALLSLPAESLVGSGMRLGAGRSMPATSRAHRSQDRTIYFLDFVDPATVAPGDDYTTWVLTREADGAVLEVASFHSRVRADGLGHDTLPPPPNEQVHRFREPVAEQTGDGWPRVEEPFRRTLVRNLTIAAVVGVVFAVRRQQVGVVLPVMLLSMWFSLGGHYVELAFLNGIRPRLSRHRVTQTFARVVTWAAGGVLLFVCMSGTARALFGHALPLRSWWLGGAAFVGLELLAHAVLAARRLPSFYDGRG